MTVATLNTTQKTTGAAGIVAFPFTWRCDDSAWVKVYLAGVLQSSGFSIEVNDDQASSPGGTVTFDVAPDGIAVEIRREIPLLQAVDFKAYEAFPAETHELALDRGVLVAQDIDRDWRQGLADETAARIAADLALAGGNSEFPGDSFVVNVAEHGAACDGVTSDTVAVQLAIDLVESRGGGWVDFPAGTCICNVKVGSKVGLRGQGRSTVLKSAPGANAAVVEGKHFATLNGVDNPTRVKQTGDINAGDNYVQLSNLTVDGNKANNASGWGIRLWGRSYVWQNLVVQNCKSGGVWTEFTTHDGGTPEDLLESYFYTIKIASNDGDGWRYRGPHDSWLTDAIFVGNTGWAMKVEAYLEVGVGLHWNGSLSGRGWNSWLNGNSFYASGPLSLTHSIASGAGGIGIELAAGSGSCSFDVIIGGHETGIIMRGTNHRFRGTLGGNSAAAGTPGVMSNGIVVDGLGYSIIDATTFSLKNQIQFAAGDVPGASEVGPNIFRMTSVVTGTDNTLISGAPSGWDMINIHPGGVIGEPIVRSPPPTGGQFFNGGITIWQASTYGTLVKAHDDGTVMSRWESADGTKAAQILGTGSLHLSGGAVFGLDPTPAVTGSKGGNAALTSLISALVTIGLISDSTS